MTILIALIPMIGWGLMPVVARKNKSNTYETMLGTTLIVLFMTTLLFLWNGYSYSFSVFSLCMLSGVFWGFGQLFQFEALNYMAVSEAMPISNGSQLLFTTITSGLLLNEWLTVTQAIQSLLCLAIIVGGIYQINKGNMEKKTDSVIKATLMILVSSLSLTLYVSITNYFEISGSLVFFPQALGMTVTSAVIAFSQKKATIRVPYVIKNWLTGILWLIANISIFYSIQLIGLGLAYSISQLAVIVSVVGGIFILGEKKDGAEARNLKIGSMLMIIGIIALGLNK